MSGPRYAQFCALARAAEVVGERWTLLILRELLLGPKRFSDLAERLDGVSPALLTSRLGALMADGVVRRVSLPYNVQAYELTELGQEVRPAIHALIVWGGRFLFPPRPDDHFEPDWVMLGLEAVLRPGPTPPDRIALVVRHGSASGRFLLEGGEGGARLSRSDAPAVAVVDTTFDVLLRILSADVALDDAIAGARAVLEGDIEAARSLPAYFTLSQRPKLNANVQAGPAAR